jgi:hypothetical protein
MRMNTFRNGEARSISMMWLPRFGCSQDAISRGVGDTLQGAARERHLSLSMQAEAFRGVPRAAIAAVAIEIDGRRFTFSRRGPDGPFENALAVRLVATNAHGTVVRNESLQFPLRLSPETHHHATTFGLRLNPRLLLPPGRYRLHVFAREREGRAAGTACCDLDVPDFTDRPLMLSGVALTAASARLLYAINPDEAMERVLPGPATSTRVFFQGDVLGVFVEAYSNTSEAAARIAMASRLVRDDGQVVFSSAEPPHPANGGNNPGEQRRYLVHVPLRAAPPGAYVLNIEARLGDSVAGPTNACRSVSLAVRADPGLVLDVGLGGLLR